MQKYKEKKKNEGKWRGNYTCLLNEGSHEMSLFELNIIQIIDKPASIGNAIPPKLLLSISHGRWDKHELWRI